MGMPVVVGRIFWWVPSRRVSLAWLTTILVSSSEEREFSLVDHNSCIGLGYGMLCTGTAMLVRMEAVWQRKKILPH